MVGVAFDLEPYVLEEVVLEKGDLEKGVPVVHALDLNHHCDETLAANERCEPMKEMGLFLWGIEDYRTGPKHLGVVTFGCWEYEKVASVNMVLPGGVMESETLLYHNFHWNRWKMGLEDFEGHFGLQQAKKPSSVPSHGNALVESCPVASYKCEHLLWEDFQCMPHVSAYLVSPVID